MVLVRLDVVEVLALADIKSVVTVELDESAVDNVTRAVDQKTEVVELLDTDIIVLSATSVGHGVNWEGDITDSQVGLDVGALNVAVLVNNDVSEDPVSEVVVADLEGAGVHPQALVLTVVADVDLAILGESLVSWGEGLEVTLSWGLLTWADYDGVTVRVSVTDATGEQADGVKQDLASALLQNGSPVIEMGVAEELATSDVVTVLDSPDELLGGVVEVELVLAVLVSSGLLTSELQLLNKVFVTDLSEAATLLRVEVDVVNE